MRDKLNIIDIEVVFVHQTDGAYLVKAHEDAQPVWIPKSQCQIEEELTRGFVKGEVVELSAPQSVLEEKGLV